MRDTGTGEGNDGSTPLTVTDQVIHVSAQNLALVAWRRIKRHWSVAIMSDCEPAAKRQKLSSLDYTGLQAVRPTEHNVGIQRYVDESISPFQAIIKHRFTDFLVHEVDQNGNVVHLTNVSKPEEPVIETPTAQPVDLEHIVRVSKKAPGSFLEKLSQDWRPLQEKLGEQVAADLKVFWEAGVDKAARMSSKPIDGKAERTAIHGLIRTAFGGKLLTETKQDGDDQLIEFLWKQGNPKSDRRSQANKNQPPFIHFTLHKFNRETHDAVGQIARYVSAHPRDLGMAGTKDKRAVTCQRVSLKRGRRSLLDVWNAIRDRLSGIRIGDMVYASKPIELGQLQGNHFVITLRDVKSQSQESIERAVNVLKERGFINYFGMQRFGNSDSPTHALGLSLLQQRWEHTVSLIMQDREYEADEVREARRFWNESQNARAAHDALPRQLVAERAVMQHIAKQQEKSDQIDYLGALGTIPKNLKMMYVHGYQSYIWNTLLSERIRLYGIEKPIEGDLVWASEEEGGLRMTDVSTDSSEVAPDHLEKLIKTSKVQPVKALTKDDLDKYTIFDVVMPLPGFIVRYPAGALGELYRSMLKTDGLNPDDLARKQPEFSMSGTYRKIMHKPTDFSYHFLRYDDADQDLASTDEDRVIGRSNLQPEDFKTGQHQALRLEFTLASSTYATMALREIMKTDTSSTVQRSLTEAMQERLATAANTSTDQSHQTDAGDKTS